MPSPRRSKSALLGMSHNDYIIHNILLPCPFEFMKDGDVWYKRRKKSKGEWTEVSWRVSNESR